MKYVYRGMVIVDYDQERKEVTFPNDPEGGGAAIQHVRIIPDDAALLAEFFTRVHEHMVKDEGQALEDIIV